LEDLLVNAGLTWRDYAENISPGTCPLASINDYTPHHIAALYFLDDTGPSPPNAASPYCVANVVPFSNLAVDLTGTTCANYNFIDPDQLDDMHTGTIQEADTWLSTVVPEIMASQAYQDNGAIFITWDEAYDAAGDEVTAPIGMIVLSPLAKGGGYFNNAVTYSHSSTLRSVEEIFGLSPMLGDAANATDLSDMFSSSCVAWTPTPSPTVTPTFTITQTFTVSPTPSVSPSSTLTRTFSPTPAYSGSGLGKVLIGPNPVRQGQSLSVFFKQAPQSCSADVFNMGGERVTHVNFGDPAWAGLSTARWAPGIYFVRLVVDGTAQWQKVAVTR
jgi:Phosphoesterase family